MTHWIIPKEGRTYSAMIQERDEQIDILALFENLKLWNWGVIDTLGDRDLIIKGTILTEWGYDED